MFSVLLLTIFLTGVITIGINLYFNPGFVLISWYQHTLETNFLGLLILFFAVIAGFYLVKILTSSLRIGFLNTFKWYNKYRTDNAKSMLVKAILLDDPNQIKQLATKSLTYSPFAEFNYALLAKYGDDKEISSNLANLDIPNDLLQTSMLKFLHEKEQYQRGIQLLQDPSFAFLRKEWWSSFITKAKRYDLVINNYVSSHWKDNLSFVKDAFVTGISTYPEFEDVYKNVPNALKYDADITISYVKRLRKEGEFDTAHNVLNDTLKQQYSDALMSLIYPSTVEVEFFNKLLSKFGNKSGILEHLAVKYKDDGDLDKGIEALKLSVKNDPKSSTYYMLGDFYLKAKAYQNAAESFKQAARLTFGKDLMP